MSTSGELGSLMSSLQVKEGATEEALRSLMSQLKITLPEQYRAFMRISNGAEGFIADRSYISIWPLEEVKSLNEAYAVNEFAPGLLLFASDGGDTAYAFDMRSHLMPIVKIPFVGMSLEAVESCASTLLEFLKHLARR